MKILNWNIRGMNSSRKKQALHDIINHQHIDLIAIQETKTEDFSTRLLNSISNRFDIWHFLPSHGKSGGILVGGDSNTINIISSHTHTFCVDIMLENKKDSSLWQFTVVYAPVKRHLKAAFWAELDSIRSGHHEPWVLCGDFNAIRNNQEKSGPSLDLKLSRLFNHFINRHHLIECRLNNRKFTWSNGHHFALLDRFFISIA